VFRHPGNRKWFAIVMDVPDEKLGLEGDAIADIVNVKLDPGLVDELSTRDGFLPAYHMNKKQWVSVRLDGSVDTDKLTALLDESFQQTS
jgi:predicted DNA-binding protein (MmcQ/YjbR family)